MSSFRLVQITDCHLGSEPNECLLGLNTDQSLRDVLDTIKANEKPDMLLATGDMSNDGGEVSYARFLKILDEYFPQVPVAWLPGNHDLPENMFAIAGHPIEESVEVNGWNLILLDSCIPGEEGGRFPESELNRLERELMAKPDAPTAIFMHHQPVPVGSAWVDTYVIENHQAFFDITDRFEQVKLLSWGHIHQSFESQRKGVDLMATPSTCVQFEPNQDKFQVSEAMPGYRCYNLRPDGQFETSIKRIEEKAYNIDMASIGY
jgi:Icc protein